MARGVRFGRKLKLSFADKVAAIRRVIEGEKLGQVAKSYSVNISMISRLCNDVGIFQPVRVKRYPERPARIWAKG